MDLPLEAALAQFTMDLRADKSPRTVQTYRDAVLHFRQAAPALSRVSQVSPASIRDWITAQREGGAATASIDNRYRGLRAFLKWCVAEGLLESSPAAGVRPPPVQSKPVPVMAVEDIQKLLKACSGRSFEDVRDNALIRLVLDTGMRRAECAGLKGWMNADGSVEGDIDFEHDVAVVTGKGNRVRACPFGVRTAKELRRYLRVRAGHPMGHLQELWITRKGAMRANSILLMLRRRAKQAGLGSAFVHQLRHTWAHHALARGLQEGDVMRLGGWKDRAMLSRYAASSADERARVAYQANSLGDLL